MTGRRDIRAAAAWCAGLVLAGAVGLVGVLQGLGSGRAATTEHVVVDRHTGLAISGFDPIAYFTDQAALPGKAEFEVRHASAVWRFRNPGNRAAFAAHPDLYMPQFGGYDPVGLARGVAVAGDPRVWMVVATRLYLFYLPEHRTAFAADSERVTVAAERQWPSVLLTLSP